MMALIEVEATLAFRDWKQGERRQVDDSDLMMQHLVSAGYLRTTAVFEALDTDDTAEPKPKRRRKVPDVADRTEPDAGDIGGTA